MSWSFHAIGKPNAVLDKAITDLEKYVCAEPEQSVKECVIEIITAALEDMPENVAVRIEAFGSQSATYDEPGKFSNSVTLKIEPLHGFVF